MKILNSTLSRLLLMLALAGLFACSSDDSSDSLPAEKISLSNVAYASDSMNKMDIVLPANRTANMPAVILIHGGNWSEGDKSDFDDYISLFADQGVVPVAINYRYANAQLGLNYDSILGDIHRAILFLKSKKTSYGCNFSNLTILGMSAGGHLALLYAYKYNPDAEVSKVVSIVGPTNLTDSTYTPSQDVLDKITNMVGSTDVTKWKEASPINYNSSIPTHLYYGKLDTLVPYTQGVQMYDKIKLNNNLNKLTVYDNCGHVFDNVTYLQLITDVLAFVKQ